MSQLGMLAESRQQPIKLTQFPLFVRQLTL